MARYYQHIIFVINLLASQSYACDLVENFNGSCWDLLSTPYIAYEESKFGPLIEGASVNPRGEIFAVDFGDIKTTFQLGRVAPSQELFYQDDNKSSLLNSLRFLNSETLFVADATNHRVLKLTLDGNNHVIQSENYCSDARMLQPNDITLSVTGTVFTSGMRWLADTNNTHGDIWSCREDGIVQKLEVLGRTNGIDLSPDEHSLYVSESFNREGTPYIQNIWKYNVNVQEGTISEKTLLANFENLDGTVTNDIDGIKTDKRGNLFVARYGGSHVAVLSPEGELLGKIRVNYPNPTNLEFGGPDGKTLFIVGQCSRTGKGCVDKIRMSSAGRTWTMLQ